MLPSATLGVRTGVRVSRLGLGGAGALMDQYGPVTGEEVGELITAALDCGIDLFDTAPAYGDRLSERRLGERLPAGAFVATKVGLYSDGAGSRVDLSGASTRRSLERSLELLGRARLDLVQLHELDGASWGEASGPSGALAALERAREEGLVRFIGVTGSDVATLRRAVASDRFDTVMVWKAWNLLDR